MKREDAAMKDMHIYFARDVGSLKEGITHEYLHHTLTGSKWECNI